MEIQITIMMVKQQLQPKFIRPKIGKKTTLETDRLGLDQSVFGRVGGVSTRLGLLTEIKRD